MARNHPGRTVPSFPQRGGRVAIYPATRARGARGERARSRPRNTLHRRRQVSNTRSVVTAISVALSQFLDRISGRSMTTDQGDELPGERRRRIACGRMILRRVSQPSPSERGFHWPRSIDWTPARRSRSRRRPEQREPDQPRHEVPSAADRRPGRARSWSPAGSSPVRSGPRRRDLARDEVEDEDEHQRRHVAHDYAQPRASRGGEQPLLVRIRPNTRPSSCQHDAVERQAQVVEADRQQTRVPSGC